MSVAKKTGKLTVYISILCCLLIAYLPFVQRHFSSDSYANIGTIDTTIHLVNGRIVTYVIQSIVNGFGIDVVMHQDVVTPLFVCILALSLTLMYSELKDCLKSKISCATAFVGMLLVYENVFFSEWLLYSESLTSTGVGLIILTVAIVLASRKLCYKNMCFATLLLIVTLNMYQLYVEFFVVLSCTLIFARCEGRLTRESLVHSVIVIVEAGVASILTIVTQPMISKLFGVPAPDRAATFELDKIIDNIVSIAESQRKIWYTAQGLLPKFVLISFFVFVLGSLLFECASVRDSNGGMYVLLGLVVSMGVTFAPHIISSVVWLAPRTMPGIFHILTFLLVAIAVKMDTNRYRRLHLCVVVLSGLFVIVNAYSAAGIVTNNIATNRLDENCAHQIETKIEEYQNSTGIEITKIATINDESPTYSYDGIQYVTHDMNIRGLVVSWGDVNLINYYCNRNYEKTSMLDEVYTLYFEGKNWDSLVLDEQAVFLDDTLYLAMY